MSSIAIWYSACIDMDSYDTNATVIRVNIGLDFLSQRREKSSERNVGGLSRGIDSYHDAVHFYCL